MASRKFSPIVLVFFLALIGAGLWWFLRPTAVVPEKKVAMSPPAKIDSVKIIAQVAQVEQPRLPAVTPKPETTPVADTPINTDPQANLNTVISDLARMAEAGDMAGKYKTYTPPEKLNPKTIQTLERVQQRSATLASQDPRLQLQLKQQNDAAARSWEALEAQTPIYNAAGDEATYIWTTPDYPGPAVSEPMTFIKINGKWYQKPSDANNTTIFVGRGSSPVN